MRVSLPYPADPPTVDEIVAVMLRACEDRHGWRLRAVIVALWRGGPRVQEALALGEHDLDPRRGSLLVRNGEDGRRRDIGHGCPGLGTALTWLAARVALPIGPLFCVIDGPTRGRPWSSANVRLEFRRLAAQAGRQAPLRAAPTARRPRGRARAGGRAAERDPASARPLQARHDLDCLQCIDTEEIIATVHARRHRLSPPPPGSV